MYEVQTYYGTHRKYFRLECNAKKYKERLSETIDLDKDLIEIYKFEEDLDEIIITED